MTKLQELDANDLPLNVAEETITYYDYIADYGFTKSWCLVLKGRHCLSSSDGQGGEVNKRT